MSRLTPEHPIHRHGSIQADREPADLPDSGEVAGLLEFHWDESAVGDGDMDQAVADRASAWLAAIYCEATACTLGPGDPNRLHLLQEAISLRAQAREFAVLWRFM